ncbi:hypothetical protein B0H14DRAFT_2472407, partial [Mycena olivaceomarginata]
MVESLHSCPKCMHVFSLPDAALPPLTPTIALRDILETNDPPLDTQIPLLRDLLSNRRARMAALDAKIALFRSLLARLLEEKAELNVEIGMHEGGLSLLRCMPTEILSHIFKFSLPPHQTDAEHAPWTVSAVCARWRTIVMSQSSFWTSIRYVDTSCDETNGPKYETQLLRSGQSHLDVEFVVDEWGDLLPEEEAILQLICKHAGHWETVSFSGPRKLFRLLRRSIQDQLTRLRMLTIEIGYNQDEAPSLNMFYDSPLLRAVYVNRGLWSFPVTMLLPWSQLSGYGGSNTWDGHLQALRSASNLVDCSLEILRVPYVTQTPITIVLPRLLRLSVSKSHFLGWLETP